VKTCFSCIIVNNIFSIYSSYLNIFSTTTCWIKILLFIVKKIDILIIKKIYLEKLVPSV
jgi:hypothetical protein